MTNDEIRSFLRRGGVRTDSTQHHRCFPERCVLSSCVRACYVPLFFRSHDRRQKASFETMKPMCRNSPLVGFFFSPQGKKGDMIGNRYKVLGDVGLGTFGRVVECWDMKRRRQVAVKVVRKVRATKNTAALSKRPVRLCCTVHTRSRRSPRHVARPWTSATNQGEVCLVFPCAPRGRHPLSSPLMGRNPRDVDAPPFVRTRAVR